MPPTDAQTLLNSLGALIEQLTSLKNNSGDLQARKQLQTQLDKLNAQRDDLLEKQFDADTLGYAAATAALSNASAAAKTALDSLQATGDAVKKATAFSTALDSLIQAIA